MKHRKFSKRFYTYGSRLYFRHKIEESDYKNQYDEDKLWHGKEEWFIFLGFVPKLWDREDLYYDGHRVKSLVVLGLWFGMGYSYDCRRKEDWTEQDLAEW